VLHGTFRDAAVFRLRRGILRRYVIRRRADLCDNRKSDIRDNVGNHNLCNDNLCNHNLRNHNLRDNNLRGDDHHHYCCNCRDNDNGTCALCAEGFYPPRRI